MPKNIVFCADGTWDDPNRNSNVYQLYNALVNEAGIQFAAYDSGVGADGNPIEKILGGGLGAGLFQKVKDGYAAVASQYVPGDQIFLFGFSRGAYTARSLAGMIAVCGLPAVGQSDPACVSNAFQAYRDTTQRDALLSGLNAEYAMDDAKIQFLGVWDTVGSLGIPAIFGDIDIRRYGFLDTTLHPDVLNAAQALSIDEQRLQFQPSLWTSPPSPGHTLTQVWFSGVHCDVGGGYSPDPNGGLLSKITLGWMANCALPLGLKVVPGSLPGRLPADALATLHESRTGAYRILPAHLRTIAPGSSISSSAKERCETPVANYTPRNLQINAGKLASAYNIVAV
ncbi:MAG: DUF2235 domain-containing protein [Terriglobia bacterium]